jgi:hypothetical protein
MNAEWILPKGTNQLTSCPLRKRSPARNRTTFWVVVVLGVCCFSTETIEREMRLFVK